MTQVIRAFIAIELPPATQTKLGEISRRLQKDLQGAPIRWVKAENIHLTLKFLGEVSLNNLQVLKDILTSEAADTSPFEISIGDLGAFPSSKRARVLWVSVAAPQELLNLQRSIESQTTRLGYSSEDRPFTPHLTLARVNRSAAPPDYNRIAQALQATQIGFVDVVAVKDIKLFKSDLQPGGSVYTCLHTAPFKLSSTR
ncbi:MAG: RNA 2',3'-cyclic phosphodiesterase [Chloroflexota bacterium]